jgi:N-acetylglucosaminyldiphosphoundecaprenol N-acetyl-beta-D-mannosaminyltransferase
MLPSFSRVDVLGVGVSAINMANALDAIEDWIGRREQHYVCVTGVHGIMESQRDERLKEIHNRAGLVTPDGMPLVWLSRWKGYGWVERVYGPDLMLAVCEQSQSKGYRQYFYGGADGVPEKLADRLTRRFPAMQAVGMYSPPYRCLTPEEDESVIKAINQAKPDIVWVGLSTPKQEYWMHQHIGRINAPVMIGVGAAFDFHAGLKKQAPGWMQQSGLEWCFRLLTEPKRLWRRYLINNPWFLWLLLQEALRKEKSEETRRAHHPARDDRIAENGENRGPDTVCKLNKSPESGACDEPEKPAENTGAWSH